MQLYLNSRIEWTTLRKTHKGCLLSLIRLSFEKELQMNLDKDWLSSSSQNLSLWITQKSITNQKLQKKSEILFLWISFTLDLRKRKGLQQALIVQMETNWLIITRQDLRKKIKNESKLNKKKKKKGERRSTNLSETQSIKSSKTPTSTNESPEKTLKSSPNWPSIRTPTRRNENSYDSSSSFPTTESSKRWSSRNSKKTEYSDTPKNMRYSTLRSKTL